MNEEQGSQQNSQRSAYLGAIGIVMTVFSTEHLEEALGTILSQSCERWSLIIQPMSVRVATELTQWKSQQLVDQRISVNEVPFSGSIEGEVGYGEALKLLCQFNPDAPLLLVLDDCDMLASHAIDVFLEAFQEMPWAAAIRACREFIDKNGSKVAIPEWVTASPRGYFKGATVDLLSFAPPTAIRTSAINLCEGWDLSLSDNFVMCDMFTQLEEQGEIEFLPDTLLAYRLGCYSHREQPDCSLQLTTLAEKMLKRRGLDYAVTGRAPLLSYSVSSSPRKNITDIDFVVPHYESNEVELSHFGSRVTNERSLEFHAVRKDSNFYCVLDSSLSLATRVEFEYSTTGPVIGRFELIVANVHGDVLGAYRRDFANEDLSHQRASFNIQPQAGMPSHLIARFLPLSESTHCPVLAIVRPNPTATPVLFCRLFQHSLGACKRQLDKCLKSLLSCGVSEQQICVVRDIGSAARNRNRGVERTTRELVCFVDDDVICTDHTTFETLLDAMHEEQWDVVGPKILQTSGAIYCANPSLTNQLTPMVNYGQEDCDGLSIRSSVSWLPTTLLLSKRSVLSSVGGFDETFPGSQMEDTDWALRATFRGFVNGYVGDVAILHENYQRCAYHYDNLSLFRKKWQRRWPI